ncbi:MAG: bifunctional glutamate N-acetyltransferase/amino-acid acetyltransferase ArgJ [Bacteroidota bacterium]
MTAKRLMQNEVEGGITAPRGFLAAGVRCGIKMGKKDLALIYTPTPARAAAVFTTNRVLAAPVLACQAQLQRNASMQALVINSGMANACTGEQGMKDAWSMVRDTAKVLGIPETEVLVSSTGVIGKPLPMKKIGVGIRRAAAALAREEHTSAAEAILTTDTFTKELAVRTIVDGVPVTIGGMAKGSGMIAPNMATMLAFVSTDACISASLLRKALKRATDRSFHRISVDGDTSTNDMVGLFANGMARNRELRSVDDPAYAPFYAALEHLLVRLSKMIVLDGEGATKFVEINVRGASSDDVAVVAAKAIANSNLVKTAIHGEDANWGRILAAIGYSGIDFDPAKVEIFFGDLQILKRGYGSDFSEKRAKEVLGQKDIVVTVGLHQGEGSASFWTCDLSKRYVEINAKYRT